jgi:hypothetical protein
MTSQSASRQPQIPEEDLRDLLARLYREIGISAVAAALTVTSKRDSKASDKASNMEPSSGLLELHGKDLAD